MVKDLRPWSRCKLFEDISKETWDRVIRAHDVNVDLKEVGITADIIVDILQFSKNFGGANIDVYAQAGKYENVFGSDIDVFVETQNDRYVWFALQAKLLKKNNRYDMLRDSSNSTMQWEKLRLLEKVVGCKSFYLLYNGKEKFNHEANGILDICGKSFDKNQFGCSLVEPEIIENFANLHNWSGFISPKFEDFHPEHAQPWRILTCCKNLSSKLTVYNINEIVNSNTKLVKIDPLVSSFDSFDEESNVDGFSEIPFVPDNKINAAMRGLSWNPSRRLIFHLE